MSVLIITGTSEQCSLDAYKLACTQKGILYSTAGVHPHDAKGFTDKTLHTLQELAKHPEVVAIGECGLDYDRDFSPRPKQREVFEAQINLAIETGKGLFLHERAASTDFIEIMAKYKDKSLKACVHCFTGTEVELKKYLEMGYYIGITGWINDERRGLELQKIVKLIPLDKIMIETDAPFLTPRDRPAELRAVNRNEPCLLPLVLHKLATCMGVTPELLATSSTTNAKLFFGLS